MSEQRKPSELPSQLEFLVQNLESRRNFAVGRNRDGFRYASSRGVEPESPSREPDHSQRGLREEPPSYWKNVSGRAVDGRFKTYLREQSGQIDGEVEIEPSSERDVTVQRQSLLTRMQSLRRPIGRKPPPPPTVRLEDHPLLWLRGFVSVFLRPLKDLHTPTEVAEIFTREPVDRPDTKNAVRALLRHGGFKPSGRSKPAWEYLEKARIERRLSLINPAVDFCNAFSLGSGIPISVFDYDLLEPPLSVRLAGEGESYVFNPSGQRLDIAGLLTLYDANGPAGGPVKDSQRTKTHPKTTRTLTLLWGPRELQEHVDQACRAYRAALTMIGAASEDIRCE